MSMRRTPSGIPIWFIGALFFALVIGLQLYFYVEKQKYHQLRSALGGLQMELERYAVDTEGSYPDSLEQLIAERKIRLPKNPFGKGPLKILKPGDPWEPGGIVYVAWGPVVAVSKGAAQPPIYPTDFDDYVLVAYSSRRHKGKTTAIKEAKQYYEENLGTEQLNFLGGMPKDVERIDWEHVALLLTAGVDYESHR